MVRGKARKLPHIQFYVGDWMKDPAVSRCSPATRGIWLDMLCAMHEDDRSGIIIGNAAELSRACRCSKTELLAAIAELERFQVAEIMWCVEKECDCHAQIRVTNRRMEREWKEREKGRNRKKKTRNGTPKVEQKPESSRECPGQFPLYDIDNDNDVSEGNETGAPPAQEAPGAQDARAENHEPNVSEEAFKYFEDELVYVAEFLAAVRRCSWIDTNPTKLSYKRKRLLLERIHDPDWDWRTAFEKPVTSTFSFKRVLEDAELIPDIMEGGYQQDFSKSAKSKQRESLLAALEEHSEGQDGQPVLAPKKLTFSEGDVPF